MAVSVNLNCPICGNHNLKVRTSEKVGARATQTQAVCPSCLSVFDISSSIKSTKTVSLKCEDGKFITCINSMKRFFQSMFAK